MALVLGIPPSVLQLVQQGLIERAFHDALYPALQFRQEALVEEWPANTGQDRVMTRAGLLPAITDTIDPGTDPTPQALTYEQWTATLGRYSGSVDTHMPTSTVAVANLFLRNVKQLGLQAGQSMNRVARNALCKSYLSGQTLTTAGTLVGDTTIQVAAINGFTTVITPGPAGSVRPVPVSPATPLPITIAGVAGTRNVVQAIPNDPTDVFGPGVLVLSAAVGAVLAARAPVLSLAKPEVIRSGGGTSVDAIGPGDVATLQDFINAANQLRSFNVQPHEDGYFHAHISPAVASQLFTDPAVQRLFTALPNSDAYQTGFIGVIAGIAFYMNTESPTLTNSGKLTATGALSVYAKDMGSEVVNAAGVRIGRTLITGRGALYEMWQPGSNYVTEAGVTGKMGEFDIVNTGITIPVERIDLILRAPLNRLQDTVAATWQIMTSFAVPSDITGFGGGQMFKRAIIVESAVG